ncbi:MAG: hypothetical protein GXO71_03270 [Caldiserica bacterium]|nr:hypothetical protein [Caldisericota bacterium]
MSKKSFLLLLLIICAGVVLRLYQLGSRDFWYDEAWKLISSRDLYTSYLDHRPLFNFLLHFWQKVFPQNEFSIRLLPALFSILTIPVFFLLSRELMPLAPSLWGTFLLSISPLQVWYAQELRAYSLIAFLVILTAYLFLKAVKGSRKFWVAFVISSILTFYTSYITLFLLIPEAVYIYYYHPRQSRKWLLATLISIFFFSLRYYSFLYQFVFFTQSFWTVPPTAKDFFLSLENFNLGYNATPFAFHFSLLLSLPLIILAFKYKPREKRDFALIFFLFPYSFAFLFSFFLPIFITRQLFAFSALYLLYLSLGFPLFLKKRLFFALYISFWLSLVSVSLFYHYSNTMPSPLPYHAGTYPKNPFKPLSEFLRKNFKKGDVIAHTNPGTVTPLLYYLGIKKYPQRYFIIPTYQDEYWRRNILEWKVPENLSIPMIPPENLSQRENLPYQRVWLVSSDWARDWNIDIHSRKVQEWMENNYSLIQRKWLDGVLVCLFVKKKQ